MVHTLSLGTFLGVLWLLLSGHFTEPLLLFLGLFSIIAVVAIAHRMDVIDHEGHPIHLTWRALVYWPWLLWEIAKANFDVAKAIVKRPMDLDISVFDVRASQKTELGRVIYANSITLTPGTVTIALEDDTLTVHALTRGAAAGVKSGDMDRRVKAVEGEE